MMLCCLSRQEACTRWSDESLPWISIDFAIEVHYSNTDLISTAFNAKDILADKFLFLEFIFVFNHQYL